PARMMVGGTPYREPVANVLLAEAAAALARGGGPFLAAALRTLTNLSVDAHRPLIHGILVRPGLTLTVRHAAAWATPHCAGQHPEAAWRRILATQFALWKSAPSNGGESILHGVTYGIGTDGHRRLLAEIRDDPAMPHTAR